MKTMKTKQNINEPLPASDLFGVPHCVETLECGVWETQDVADSLEDAMLLASSLCNTLPEDRIRISTPDHKLL